jgi:glutaredoxin
MDGAFFAKRKSLRLQRNGRRKRSGSSSRVKSPILLQKLKKRSGKRKKPRRSLVQRKNRHTDGNYQIIDTKPSVKPVWKIYSLEGCSYCTNAAELLKQKNQEVKMIYEKDLTDAGEKARVAKEIGDFQTFPRIFKPINKGHKFIGGYQELKALFAI